MISGFGFQEMLVIALVTLLVFGPKRLPELMRMAGRLSRDLRRLAWEFRSALEIDSLDDDLSKKRSVSQDNSDYELMGSEQESRQTSEIVKSAGSESVVSESGQTSSSDRDQSDRIS